MINISAMKKLNPYQDREPIFEPLVIEDKSDRAAMRPEEFKERIQNSKTLVIGADMKTYGDYSKWGKIDENYIGIRDWDNTWMGYNDNKLIDWNDEYPEEKYHGRKPNTTFSTLVKSVLGEKKFRLIIVDGGTIQYIHDMETLFKLANEYMDKQNGLLIYPVSQQTKNFPTGQSLLDESNNSFCCYNFDHRDIPKLMKNDLDLVKFVNIIFNHLGLCYVMKNKQGGGQAGDSKYIDLFTLRQLKNKSSLFMATVNEDRVMKDQKFNEWQKKREELLIDVHKEVKISERERRTILSCPPKDINKDDINSFLKKTYYDNECLEISEDDITRIKESIEQEKTDYYREFDKIPKISEQMIICFAKDQKTPDTQTLFTLISNYESEQEKIKARLVNAELPPDYGSGGVNSPRCMSSASGQGSPPHSRACSPQPPELNSPRPSVNFKRKSTVKSVRKPVRKSIRKSSRKSVRKPVRKSIRKSSRKSVRKPARKSIRKSKRKSVRKPHRKSIRKSKRKSVRKPLRKSIRKSRR
jgi:hypothetical protein